MAEFNISTIDRKQPHLYLARMQGTRKAILPVHTPAEHDLFRNLMKSNPVFNAQSSGPIWKLAVKVWNEFTDKQPGIFYKLVEQLKVHYSVWEVQVNVKQTLSMSLAIR
ncbi:hypothetical protein BYT27DRAFT_7262351 [Phlegmacium glaucopus]|nr:hypothetical protein BYT27DRAFT_7262351 [Phlegmacium glaucopus]